MYFGRIFRKNMYPFFALWRIWEEVVLNDDKNTLVALITFSLHLHCFNFNPVEWNWVRLYKTMPQKNKYILPSQRIWCSFSMMVKWAKDGLLQANDGKMFVINGEMLVNGGEMSALTSISLKKTIIISFDHHWEAAPTAKVNFLWFADFQKYSAFSLVKFFLLRSFVVL